MFVLQSIAFLGIITILDKKIELRFPKKSKRSYF